MPLNPKQRLNLIICIALAAVVVGIYWPVYNYEFINLDDSFFIVDNPLVKQGISWDGLKWAFTTIHYTYWQPLTWLSYMLDCTLLGSNAGAMHLVNVLFHIVNTILLFVIFVRMTKGVWQSAFIAGLFALHPMHVESVAWVAERRDVLSTLFWLLTMLAYVRYIEQPSVRRYIATVTVFILGLLSKPMTVTLPFVLLLLDYWPLGRFGDAKCRVSRLLLEKVPFVILSAMASAVTFLTAHKVGAIASLGNVLFNERLENSIVSYCIYIHKMIWPAQLAVLYPFPAGTIPIMKVIICGAAVILITVLFIFYGRRHKYLIVGWLWYLGTLVPVIGIVQVGPQAWADRYTYVPLIGLFLIIAFGLADLLKNIAAKKYILAPAAILILASCAAAASIQLRYWKDSIALFERTLSVTKDNAIICYNYASVLNVRGQKEKARQYIAEAARLRPDIQEIHENYGRILEALGKTDEALAEYKIALQINSRSDAARYNFGWALLQKGYFDEAIGQFRIYLGENADLPRNGVTEQTTVRFKQTLVLKPDTVEILSHMGLCFAQKQDPDMAIKYYRQALMLDPNHVSAHRRLGLTLYSMGKTDEAIEQCRIVVAAEPNDAKTYNNIGIMLQSEGKIAEAIDCFKKALEIDPKYQKARNALNAALEQKPGRN
jgi:protein O-mannosyl-transferase